VPRRESQQFREKLCIVCNRNHQRYINGTCERCRTLVEAEGTHEQLGVPKYTKMRQRQIDMAAEYNKLIAKRMTQKQIAELWKMTDRQVSSHAYRWRRAGIKVAYAWGNQIELGDKPKMATKTMRKIAEHGVGWGVTHCTCEPCKVSCRAMRAASNVLYRKRRKQKHEAAAKLAAE